MCSPESAALVIVTEEVHIVAAVFLPFRERSEEKRLTSKSLLYVKDESPEVISLA